MRKTTGLWGVSKELDKAIDPACSRLAAAGYPYAVEFLGTEGKWLFTAAFKKLNTAAARCELEAWTFDKPFRVVHLGVVIGKTNRKWELDLTPPYDEVLEKELLDSHDEPMIYSN